MKSNVLELKVVGFLGLAVLLLAAGPTFAGGNVVAGESKAAVCFTCHGAAGNAPLTPEYPKLAGQYASYLENALRDYKRGARKNPIMAGQVENLKNEDIADLAAYFAEQSSALTVKY